MLEIEIRRLPADVCADCEGSGVVLPAMRKLLTDYGVFCECAIGAEKWASTTSIVAALEEALAALPSVPPRALSLPLPRRFYWGAEPTI